MSRGKKPLNDLVGRRFGSYVAVRLAPRPGRPGKSGWLCRCDCGEERVVHRSNLLSGNSTSCGCKIPAACRAANLIHGRSRTPLYEVWSRMIARCTNPKCSDYPRWGGRGITVCERWRQSFAAFLEDMGERPGKGYLIDRIDNDGPYEPGNCRWVTAKTSSRNRRGRVMLTAFGETKSATVWLEDHRCLATYAALIQRVKSLNWDHERAITTPSARTKRCYPSN